MDIVGGQNLRQMWDDLAGVYGDKTALISNPVRESFGSLAMLRSMKRLTARRTFFIP